MYCRKKSSVTALCVGMILLAWAAVRVSADTLPHSPIPYKPILQQQGGGPVGEQDANCLMCHSDPDFQGEFADGEALSLFVDNDKYGQSVHGPAGLECVACHTTIRS